MLECFWCYCHKEESPTLCTTLHQPMKNTHTHTHICSHAYSCTGKEMHILNGNKWLWMANRVFWSVFFVLWVTPVDMDKRLLNSDTHDWLAGLIPTHRTRHHACKLVYACLISQRLALPTGLWYEGGKKGKGLTSFCLFLSFVLITEKLKGRNQQMTLGQWGQSKIYWSYNDT